MGIPITHVQNNVYNYGRKEEHVLLRTKKQSRTGNYIGLSRPELISRRMKELGISQYELCQQTGWDHKTVKRYREDPYIEITPDNQMFLSDKLGIDKELLKKIEKSHHIKENETSIEQRLMQCKEKFMSESNRTVINKDHILEKVEKKYGKEIKVYGEEILQSHTKKGIKDASISIFSDSQLSKQLEGLDILIVALCFGRPCLTEENASLYRSPDWSLLCSYFQDIMRLVIDRGLCDNDTALAHKTEIIRRIVCGKSNDVCDDILYFFHYTCEVWDLIKRKYYASYIIPMIISLYEDNPQIDLEHKVLLIDTIGRVYSRKEKNNESTSHF